MHKRSGQFFSVGTVRWCGEFVEALLLPWDSSLSVRRTQGLCIPFGLENGIWLTWVCAPGEITMDDYQYFKMCNTEFAGCSTRSPADNTCSTDAARPSNADQIMWEMLISGTTDMRTGRQIPPGFSWRSGQAMWRVYLNERARGDETSSVERHCVRQLAQQFSSVRTWLMGAWRGYAPCTVNQYL